MGLGRDKAPRPTHCSFFPFPSEANNSRAGSTAPAHPPRPLHPRPPSLHLYPLRFPPFSPHSGSPRPTTTTAATAAPTGRVPSLPSASRPLSSNGVRLARAGAAAQGRAGHRHPDDPQPRLPGDVAALLPAIPPHHRAGRRPQQDHPRPRGLRLRALQPQRHQPHAGAQGLLHLLQGLRLPLLRLHGLQEEVHLHHRRRLLRECPPLRSVPSRR